MARILLVGTVTLDLVFELDHPPGADEEMRARALRTCRGGNAANTAVVLSRLGLDTEFMGALAAAPETAVIERDFEAHGVTYRHCPKLPGRAPTSSIYLSGANRSIVHFRDLPEMEATFFEALDLHDVGWVHFEGRNIPQLKIMMAHVRENCPAARISLELEKYRPGIESTFDMADLLLCSRGLASHYGFGEPQAFLEWLSRRAFASDVVLAWGEGGAYGRDVHGNTCHVSATSPPVVIDTLGAGDTFNAGMINALLKGRPLRDAMEQASQLAGKKCGISGFSSLT